MISPQRRGERREDFLICRGDPDKSKASTFPLNVSVAKIDNNEYEKSYKRSNRSRYRGS